MGGPALVLDFGGPVLLTPFELASSEPPGSPAYQLLHERGPLAPPDRPDTEWEQLGAGTLSERDYWDRKAEQWARAHPGGGPPGDIRTLIAHLYTPARPGLVRHQARRIVADAHRAGNPVAVLTNDLSAFHSPEWIRAIDILDDIDLVVDGSVEGALKPDPRIYALTAERLGADPADMVFVDDQMVNVRGASAMGIPSVWFDVRFPERSFAGARALLGLEA
jgi:putative hydrolase of the HAD superfamily